MDCLDIQYSKVTLIGESIRTDGRPSLRWSASNGRLPQTGTPSTHACQYFSARARVLMCRYWIHFSTSGDASISNTSKGTSVNHSQEFLTTFTPPPHHILSAVAKPHQPCITLTVLIRIWHGMVSYAIIVSCDVYAYQVYTATRYRSKNSLSTSYQK